VPSNIEDGNQTVTLDPLGIRYPSSFWPPGKYIMTNRLLLSVDALDARGAVMPGQLETSITLTPAALQASRRWTFALTLPQNQTGSVAFYAWIDTNPGCQLAFDAPDAKDDHTLGDFAATPGVIAVGAYYALMADAPARYYSAEGPTERVTSAPPWEPFAESGRKPDVIAPGHGVHVALSYAAQVPQDRVADAYQRAVVASGT